MKTISFTTTLIKAETAVEIEEIALDQAKMFFGPGYHLKIRDYSVSHYGIHDSMPGAYITVEATRLR